MKTKKLEIRAGRTIASACEDAVELAMREACHVEFEFNRIVLTAPATNADGLLSPRERGMRGGEFIPRSLPA